jgi:hypothetical protein
LNNIVNLTKKFLYEMKAGHLDSEFLGFGTFSDFNEICQIARRIKYKGTSQWRLPKWEELKQLHPYDWDGVEGEMWTDNATSASYTAKRMDLKTGDFRECNQKVHYEEVAMLRLMCDDTFNEEDVQIIDIQGQQFMVLPFGDVTYLMVDGLNEILSQIGYQGFTNFRRPTIEELELIASGVSESNGVKDGWYWSSSEGGKYNAYKMNLLTGEKYSCKKSSDYSEGMAFSISVVNS